MAPYVRAHDHWPPLLIGAVWSAGPAGYGLGMVVAGRLADRLPPRRICWASLALMACGLGVAFALPGSLTFPLFYSAVGLGVGGGVGMAGSIAAAVQVLPHRVGTAGGAATGAYALAALVQVPVASRLAPLVGWTDHCASSAPALVVLAALALLLMPRLPAAPGRRRPDGPPWRRSGCSRGRCSGRPSWRSCAQRRIGAAAFVNLVTYARGLGVAAALATAALTVLALGNAAGRLAGGAAADRLGVERVLWRSCSATSRPRCSCGAWRRPPSSRPAWSSAPASAARRASCHGSAPAPRPRRRTRRSACCSPATPAARSRAPCSRPASASAHGRGWRWAASRWPAWPCSAYRSRA